MLRCCLLKIRRQQVPTEHGEKGTQYTVGGNVNWYIIESSIYAPVFKKLNTELLYGLAIPTSGYLSKGTEIRTSTFPQTSNSKAPSQMQILNCEIRQVERYVSKRGLQTAPVRTV